MIGVVACSKTKAPEPRPAVELYQGRTFKAAVEVLRARGCERFVILSACYGAVDGNRVIAPYEQTLIGAPARERRAWAATARAQLVELVGDAPLLAILPADYARALEGLPRVGRLFAGLPQGRLFAALAAARRES